MKERKEREAKGEKRRACFPRRNPRVSDLDSAYQVGEILEALSSSRFLSSLPLNSPPRVNFAPSPPLPFSSSSYFFFFSFFSLSLSLSFSLASSCVRVEGKLSLPWFLLVNTSALSTTNNFHL